MKTIKLFLIIILFSNIFFAQKREFRGSWVSTVSNLDWPSSRLLTVDNQKAELIAILDELEQLNMNAVLLQVRPECDAFYNSSIEPWSYWLTGTQGTAPSPTYDPLAFAVDEAHKRGIELYAWLNPFRAVANIGNYTQHSSHVTNQHPEWILTFNSIDQKLLDPGKAAVRAYVQSVVLEIVNNYDVDGIVFDDYFYPYPNSSVSFVGITTEDASTYASESRGFTNLQNWRRDNVNIFVASINSAIKLAKPYVKFGISPFGIWKNGVPTGIIGMDAYNEIYCDATAWLNAETVDFLSPQLYWPFGGAQDYGTLLPWWGTQINGRHLYSSLALYRSSGWASDELTNQIDLNRSNANCDGSIYFRHSYFETDPHGILNTLQTSYYQQKALAPLMIWLGGSVPNSPTNLQIVENHSGNTISWDNSTSPNLKFNAIYKSATTPVDISNENNLLDIVGATETSYTDYNISNTTQYYAVTTISNYDVESNQSEIVTNTLANNVILDDFETSEGHFTQLPTFSGSTVGILSTSTADRVLTDSHNGNASEQVVLKDNASSSSNWHVRLLSGGGTPANNTLIIGQYQIGVWIKTSSAPNNSQISLWIDDIDGNEVGEFVDIINDGNWHLYRWDLADNTQWSAIVNGNGEITAPNVTLDAIIFTAPNNSPDWTILIDDVYSEESTPVPVELSNFIALNLNNKVQLMWQTETEINNYGFEIERKSENYINKWEKIGFVEGSGNSNSPKQYSFYDTDNLVGEISYRLKQIDTDGKIEYSNIASIFIDGMQKTELFQNHPNPFNPSTTISFFISEPTIVKIKIYNSLGQEVVELLNDKIEAGNHEVKFDASNPDGSGRGLSSGFYIYRLETNNFSKTMKMLLIK